MDTILFPIKWVISWIMHFVHEALVFLGMSDGSGPAWVWSIVGLTIVVRILILPLFKKQINSSRTQQLIQPEIQKLQKKYKGKKDPYSQQRMQAEMQAIYRDAGTSPFASCMPLLIQTPIFFALFRVLGNLGPIARGERGGIGPITQAVASDIESSTVFGAPLSASFSQPGLGDGASETTVKVVAMVLVVIMSATMFFSQKMMISKNMPESAKSSDNPMYRTQKIMIYAMPVIFLISGVAFPIGVLVYWVVSNLWSTGQQFYMLTAAPAPGSEAYEAKQRREREKRIKAGLPPEEEKPNSDVVESRGQRVQPISKERAKRKGLSKDELAAPIESEEATTDSTGSTPPAEAPKKKLTKKQRQAAAAKAREEEEAAARAREKEEARKKNSRPEGVGKDGLTAEERAQRRAERAAAQREANLRKREERAKRQNQHKKKDRPF